MPYPLGGLGSSMLIEIGHVEAIFRYPVKSMGGERLEVANLGCAPVLDHWEQLPANRVRFPILKGLQPPFCDRVQTAVASKRMLSGDCDGIGRPDSAGI
jgi:hypothetical protein